MDYLNLVNQYKDKAYAILDESKRSSLGQFYTPYSIAQFMASLFDEARKDIHLLDPGCGLGSLTTAFIERFTTNDPEVKIDCSMVDIETNITPLIKEFIGKIESSNVNVFYQSDDFITPLDKSVLDSDQRYTHCIMNPPYKKIPAKGHHRKILREYGFETGNLYSAFIMVAIHKLKPGGELVAIIPRSFCNGTYFQPFRDYLLANTSISHIHIFESRKAAFKEDKVLQENIIIKLIKNGEQGDVTISSTDTIESLQYKPADNLNYNIVNFNKVVHEDDKNNFIHIKTSIKDDEVMKKIEKFSSSIDDLEISVSTGPVVGFRSRQYLKDSVSEDDIPLFYPAHLKVNSIDWPSNKKPNGLTEMYPKKIDFWLNKGAYLLVNRFSAKEEKKRIVAHYFCEFTTFPRIAFENKLNVFHVNKGGFCTDAAKGLYIYLNSTLVDSYFRLFSGHTQVNATDLRNLNYPSLSQLQQIGQSLNELPDEQELIDKILEQFI